jgi:hypothetical protein
MNKSNAELLVVNLFIFKMILMDWIINESQLNYARYFGDMILAGC